MTRFLPIVVAAIILLSGCSNNPGPCDAQLALDIATFGMPAANYFACIENQP